MGLTTLFPNNYRLNNREYVIPVPQTLPISMFLNTPPLTYADFANLRLSAVDAYGNMVFPDIATLQQVSDGEGGYQLYFEDLAVDGGTLYQEWYLIVYDIITEEVLFRSNCFQTRPVGDGDNLARLSYRNSSNIFNFKYEELPDFRQVYYVDLNHVGSEPEYDNSVYAEVTTGFIRQKKSQLKHAITIASRGFDDRASKAMVGLSLHDDIEVNFTKYQVKEGYTYGDNRRSNRAEGKIVLYVQNDNEINLNG
jgi:hypothetical protein